MVEIAEKDDWAPPQGGGRIRQEPPTREYPKACALVFMLTRLRNLLRGNTQGLCFDLQTQLAKFDGEQNSLMKYCKTARNVRLLLVI